MARIAVFGLGKLGCPLAAALASRDHDVIGVDLDARFVRAVNERRSPVYEPGLQQLMRESGGRLSATEDGAAAVDRSEISFVVLPTPSRADGSFSLDHVLPAIELIGRTLKERPEGSHLVVITSTVMPGSMDGPVRETLEQASGRTLGSTLGLCYNPEFVALGSVIRDTLEPELLLIGESDSRAGERLEEVLRTLYRVPKVPAVHRIGFANAELTKIAVNAFITTKISYANTLARICERLPGTSVDEVTAALGADSRIGPRYLRGAVGYGGPCFPRDNIAFLAMAKKLGAEALLAEATDRVNRQQAAYLADLSCEHLPAGGVVSVLGLAYKPNTDVCDVSPGLTLAQELAARGVRVAVYDPAAMDNARRILADTASYSPSAKDCLARGDVAVLTVEWDEFKALRPPDFRAGGTQTVIDCWRMLEPNSTPANVRVVPLGFGLAG